MTTVVTMYPTWLPIGLTACVSCEDDPVCVGRLFLLNFSQRHCHCSACATPELWHPSELCRGTDRACAMQDWCWLLH